MVVPYQLTRLRPGICESKPENHVVKAPFKHNEKRNAGYTLSGIRPFEKKPELIFAKAISAFNLLFFAQLQAIVGNLAGPALAMLPRRISASVDSAFI